MSKEISESAIEARGYDFASWEQGYKDALEIEGVSGKCTWTRHEFRWDTECGGSHQFTYDGPEENGYEYCPYCGRVIWIRKTIDHEPENEEQENTTQPEATAQKQMTNFVENLMEGEDDE